MTQRKKDNGNNIAAAFLIGVGIVSVLLAAGTEDARDEADYLGHDTEDLVSTDVTDAMTVGGLIAAGAGAWILHKNEKER